MNIVSACDAKYFHCLVELAKSVRTYYEKPLIVYDIGLTEEQVASLDAVVIPIEINPKADFRGKAYIDPNGHYNTRATHKPFCVRDYFENYSEPMIFVDSDCLFTERVEESGFDVGVTHARPKKDKKQETYHGVINSGVIFFNNPAKALVDRWAEECLGDNTTDQKALSDILSESVVWENYKEMQQWGGLKIRVFDAKYYNDFHLAGTGKILHFINTRHNNEIYKQLTEGLEAGEDIRKKFREIKRGKVSRVDKLIRFFKK